MGAQPGGICCAAWSQSETSYILASKSRARDFRRVAIDAADIGCFGLMKSEPPLHRVEAPTPAKSARMGRPPSCASTKAGWPAGTIIKYQGGLCHGRDR